MPHNPELEPKRKSFKVLFGQIPLTKFKDYKKAIKVELLNPEPEDQMMERIYPFVKATWCDTPEEGVGTKEEMKDALQQMLSGKALGLGLETVNLTFRISGITRIDTHQIVRQRIGVVFSQQCSGDRFLNHNDILVEESIAKNPENLSSFIAATLATKDAYAKMNDNGVSIQAARTIIPQNLETFILMHTNLSTLLFFYQKRIDDGSQTWQINEIARQMAEEVCKAYPELKEVFEKHKTKFKFQKEASADRKNSFSTSLYIPKADEFEYNEKDFLYPMKKEEMHFTGTPIDTTYYWGRSRVIKEQYEYIKEQYNELNKKVKENNWSIEEIKEEAKEVNRGIISHL